MNWKKLIKSNGKIKIGNVYKLNPNSDKSDWKLVGIAQMYQFPYTIVEIKNKKNYENNIILRNKSEAAWWMSEEFLREHFILIDVS